MTKATLREIMKRGHQLAKKMEGDYQARIAYGLKVAWAEHKEAEETLKSVEDLKELLEKKSGEKVASVSVKKWEKYEKSRTYINLEVSAHNRAMTYYIDNKTGKAYWMSGNITSRWTKKANEAIYRTIKDRKDEILQIA